jgi:hypothetical protein
LVVNEKEKYSAMLISWYENSFLCDQSQNITEESILDSWPNLENLGCNSVRPLGRECGHEWGRLCVKFCCWGCYKCQWITVNSKKKFSEYNWKKKMLVLERERD